jgi:3-dehydroquinate synthase
MVDASVGGKTGFDLLGIKNLAGAFYPAEAIYMPLETLSTLPGREWKSGFAELIKTAILSGDRDLFSRFQAMRNTAGEAMRAGEGMQAAPGDDLLYLIARAVEIKGRIVEEDPRETGQRRALLNLGHTFGHALEASAGFGRLSHGEAVAWGMVRACELGQALGVTSSEWAGEIRELLQSFGYTTTARHPAIGDPEEYCRALGGDKKKKDGKLVFVVPTDNGAKTIALKNGDPQLQTVLRPIINGEYNS